MISKSVIKNFFIAIRKVFPKNKYSFFFGAIALLLTCGCGKDQVEVPNQVLEGKIGGQTWVYGSANAFLESSDLAYKVTFLSNEESISDPCALRSTSQKHVTALLRLPEFSGDYSVTRQLVSDNEVIVTFHESISKALVATGGFMSIYARDNNVIIGYLEAVADSDNTVKGSFEIRVCN